MGILINSKRTDKLSLTASEESRLTTANWRALAIRARFQANALAKLVGFSLRRLESHFQSHANCTPREWLHELRMRISAQRLAEGASVDALVTELSFFDRSHFHHWFRDFYGISPREFVATWKRNEPAGTSRDRHTAAPLSSTAGLAKTLEDTQAPLKILRRGHLSDHVMKRPLRRDRAQRAIIQAMKGLLSPREVEVCLMVLDGTEKEAAIGLEISVHTVHALCERAFKKLGVHSRRALVAALAGHSR